MYRALKTTLLCAEPLHILHCCSLVKALQPVPAEYFTQDFNLLRFLLKKHKLLITTACALQVACLAV